IWGYPMWNAPYKGAIVRKTGPTTIGVTLENITDNNGTANTFLVGEKWLNYNNYQNGDWHDDQGWIDGWDPDVIRYTGFPPIKDSAGSPYGWDGYMFGSAHTAGLNMCMADGSVRFINYSVDLTAFNCAGSRLNTQPFSLN